MPRYHDDDDYDDLDIRRYRRTRERQHEDGPRPQSGLGIASLILAIFCGVSMFGLVMIAGIISIEQNGQVNDRDPVMMAVSLGILAACGFTLIGLVLGLIGCFQSDRNPLCGILGSVFNGLILLGVGSLICLGVLVGA